LSLIFLNAHFGESPLLSSILFIPITRYTDQQ
jgi:hypothetical protein